VLVIEERMTKARTCGNTDSNFFALDPKLVPKPEVWSLVISKI
jgi:hypothetical protein